MYNPYIRGGGIFRQIIRKETVSVMKQNNKTKDLVLTISYITVLAFHAVSALCIAFKLIFMSDSIETEMQRSNLKLMLLQCVLACIVIHAPLFIKKVFKMQIPAFLCIAFWFFLFGSVFLGEVAKFYYTVPHWDTFLHLLSSLMTGLLGYMVFAMLFKGQDSQISPTAAIMFALCFSVAIGAIWEIYEFTCDGLLGLNMQKFAFEDGVEKVGRLALLDTMKDIIIDTVGAVLSSVYGYVSLKSKHGFVYEYFCSQNENFHVTGAPANQPQPVQSEAQSR